MLPYALIATLSSLVLPLLTQAQDAQTPIVYDSIHNATAITGTWSTGSQAVLTGPGFANPLNSSFIYPKTTGISYSFSDAGFFEEAQYRFNGNGSQPQCIQGVVIFQHGQYSLNSNGSIILTPFGEDGRIQVQDACAAKSNVITIYNQTVLFSAWRIFTDPVFGPKLHIFAFDGTPLAPMFRVYSDPLMLPTRVLSTNLTNTTVNIAIGAAMEGVALGGRGAITVAAGAATAVLLATSALFL